MGKRAVSVSSLVILLALLSFILEVCIYYFVPWHIVSVFVAIVVSVVLSHYFLEMTLDYDSCFLFSAFMTISSTAFCIIVYLLQPNPWIDYDYSLLVLVLVNWLFPFAYCFLRDFADRGPRFDGYIFFFHAMSAVFAIIYGLAVIKQFFITPVEPPYEAMAMGAHSFVPFMSTGTYIESVLNQGPGLTKFIAYLLEVIVFAIPFGFYARVYTRFFSKGIRMLTYLLIPCLIEVLQFVTGRGRGDIDDFALAMIGTLIGIAIYHLVYAACDEVNKRDFLEDRTVNKSLLFHF